LTKSPDSSDFQRIPNLTENAQFAGSSDADVTVAVQLAKALPVDCAAL
jgi:hypothetical protein